MDETSIRQAVADERRGLCELRETADSPRCALGDLTGSGVDLLRSRLAPARTAPVSTRPPI